MSVLNFEGWVWFNPISQRKDQNFTSAEKRTYLNMIKRYMFILNIKMLLDT